MCLIQPAICISLCTMSASQAPSDFTQTTDPINIKVMQTVWGHSPCPLFTASFILDAFTCHPLFYSSKELLLVKVHAVMQTALSLKCGLALAIMPLLALASDQESKIKSAFQDGAPVLSYHLDEYHQPSIMNTIRDQLLQMPHGTNTCVFLFTSQQCLFCSGSHGLGCWSINITSSS